jgi:hypothetical protein
MPKKADRVTPLPGGLVPLLSQKQLETYYGVSDWTVLRWVEAGMPVEPVRPASATGQSGVAERKKRMFDLERVKAWHAERAVRRNGT